MSAIALAARPWLEVWVSPDTAADHLLVLRSDDRGGCTLADPQSDWREIQHFRSYEAAYDWLSQETYRLADGRCAVR
jgi:hypothetical protein